MSLPSRLLGFAFAAADALVEVDQHGVVRFALGAGPAPHMPMAQWVGTRLIDVFDAESAARAHEALDGLKPAQRLSGVDVTIDCGKGQIRRAQLSAFCLPELAPTLSLALSYQADISNAPTPAVSGPIKDPQGFMAQLRHRLMNETPQGLQRLDLAFIDVDGDQQLPTAARQKVHEDIVRVLQGLSLDGNSATQLTNDRYALVRPSGAQQDLSAEINAVGQVNGIELTARTMQAALGSDPAAALRAMRFAIEACLREDTMEAPQSYFAETLARTLRDADHFRTLVRDREFSLHYQPIVCLGERAIHHYEALSRFPRSHGPGPAIRMAEELALIETFDRTVAEMAVTRLRTSASRKLQIAVNVSGASLANDAYITALLALTASAPELRSRLLVEVTETAALADLASANRRLASLREVGIRVCIDDFGAGSASFDYLRGLNVDFVKIDGTLVKDVQAEARSRTLIAHLVELCRSLEMQTVAEMVETEAQAQALTELGVTHAQGWLFGRAEAEPNPRLPTSTPVVARRRGSTETWG